ncbi:hypothetical protein [Maridesulfovibrio ferrireducens]|uniref:hypothetical protein n=1 Tax=Maridesulfovibrio ferrireducens TaxID=246191 RepID=UPI001A1DEE49|nr:hypothetical protein [Maridesulfovibrio ferrireducens]MBI9112253.1 hypothetical protein [Maridesulfovibrio ferrireducens]
MDFKTQMTLDAQNVFMNQNEFAESINWNGKFISAVVTDEGEGQSDGETFDSTRAGVSVEIKSVLIVSDDIERPRLHKEYKFNNEKWIVSRVKGEGVMLNIQIYREKS